MAENSEKKTVTLYDVAERAGVSHQTVSRVVNGNPKVADSTRERVIRAIHELGYTPDRVARIMSTGRSHIIQIILMHLGMTRQIAGMLRTARQLGYDVALSVVDDVSSDDVLREQLGSLSPQLIDGLIIHNSTAEISPERLLELSPEVPLVLVGNESGVAAPSVAVDDACGITSAMQHLYDLGHRLVAEIPGPLIYHGARERHLAYTSFMIEHDLEPLVPDIRSTWLADCGYAGVKGLLENGVQFTGLVCANDRIALGAYRALHEAGLSIPSDVSVIGFDNESSAEYYVPPLTTVHQDFEAVGSEAVRYLVSLIESDTSSLHRRTLSPKLVIRESTCRPSAQRR